MIIKFQKIRQNQKINQILIIIKKKLKKKYKNLDLLQKMLNQKEYLSHKGDDFKIKKQH